MAEPRPERVYRAACPGCGAPVEYRSAQSTHAVCSFCKSTIVRDGETLSRIGKMAELFDDHSPLQLMASGSWTGKAFTLVGRLQYKGPDGPWTEWHALLGDGTSALLAEDNGAYVFAVPASANRPLPEAARFRVGATTAIGGKTFSIASNEDVTLVSAQGELPKLPPPGRSFAMVELRSADGEVLSIDYGTVPPAVTRGRAIALDELRLTGLQDDNTRESAGRQFSCPSCGAPVPVRLETSKSITCPACKSLIDLSRGIGSELTHALQDEPIAPLIPLGSSGRLQAVQWQVVGYQHRMGQVPGDDEQFGWDEYLLYNRKKGFIFLVDTQEGWSIVRPTTGAPSYSDGASTATYLGTTFKQKYSYAAHTTYVAGEFYWPVERGQKSFNRDFADGRRLLSMERTPREITWSSGTGIDSALVAEAFGLGHKMALLQRNDAGPTSGGDGSTLSRAKIFWLIFGAVIYLVFMIGTSKFGTTQGDDDSWSTSGGSFGGSSSGGGHK